MAKRGTRYRTETLDAAGRVSTGPGNFFFLIAASAAVTVTFNVAGTSFGAAGIGAGYVKGEVEPWQSIVITGAPGVVVSFLEGDEDVRESFTDFRQQIISGSVTVAAAPAASIANTAPVTVADVTQAALFAANLLRKRVTVNVSSANLGSTFARTVGGTNNVKELQPGGSYTFEGTYGLDVRNDSGGPATFYIGEET